MIKKLLVIGTMVAIVGTPAFAQIKRTPLQSVDFPAGYTTTTGIFEIPAGACAGRHTHPGLEMSYLLEGEGILKVAGQPDQKVHAGESFLTQAGTVHDFCAAPGQAVKGLGIYVLEKGKPIATPAP